MSVLRLTLPQLNERLESSDSTEELSTFHGIDCIALEWSDELPESKSQPSCPVLAIAGDGRAPDVVDAMVDSEGDLEELSEAVAANPIASATLVQLLRYNEKVDTLQGLFAESLAYSTLQHGEEFIGWLSNRQSRPRKEPSDSQPILVKRTDDILTLTLNRPEKRNAWSVEMRDGLCDALHLASRDETVKQIVMQGNGPCFGAGGDLDEFGDARDAGVAHVSRMVCSAGRLMHLLRSKTTARLHGACIGAGIELPAFAKNVIAREDAFFQLPEVSMGLIPGAGGTASILPRIGRQRLAWMALSGNRIGIEQARGWGLVDRVVSSWHE